MKRVSGLTFLLCGILLTFAAFPVFAQDDVAEEIKINRQPLQDLGAFVKEKIDRGEVDLTQPFKVVLEGVLTKEGRLDTSIDKETKKPKSQFILAEGDEQMVLVAKSAIEAVDNSGGWFRFLRNMGVEKVKLTFAQDKESVIAIIESEQPTPEKANTLASSINLMLMAAKKFAKVDEDAKIILNGFQITTSNGKTVIINFAIPKQIAQDMIQRNLKKAAQAETWKTGE
jgi:hypothetical protein